MKKRLIQFALLLGLMALTCAAAQADESDEPTSGFQNIVIESGYQQAIEMTPRTDKDDPVALKDGKYPGAAKLDLTYKQAQEGKEYALFVLTDDQPPMEDNIAYIDQQTGAGGTVSFNIYPKKVADTVTGVDYNVYISSSADASAGTGITSYTKILSFSYYAAATVMRGDVSGNKVIDVADATMILENLAQMRTLDSSQSAAADVSGNSMVDVADVLMILERLAQMRDEDFVYYPQYR